MRSLGCCNEEAVAFTFVVDDVEELVEWWTCVWHRLPIWPLFACVLVAGLLRVSLDLSSAPSAHLAGFLAAVLMLMIVRVVRAVLAASAPLPGLLPLGLPTWSL